MIAHRASDSIPARPVSRLREGLRGRGLREGAPGFSAFFADFSDASSATVAAPLPTYRIAVARRAVSSTLCFPRSGRATRVELRGREPREGGAPGVAGRVVELLLDAQQ